MSHATAVRASVGLRTQGSGTLANFDANDPTNWDFLGVFDEDLSDVPDAPAEGGEEPMGDATPTRVAGPPPGGSPPHGVTHDEAARTAEVELQGLASPAATTEFDMRPPHPRVVHLLPEVPGFYGRYSIVQALHNTDNTSPAARARKSREDAACVDAYMWARGLHRQRQFNDETLAFAHEWARETNWVFTEVN